MKFQIQLLTGALLFVTSFTSCKKYLDVTPDNVATIDYAFRNRNETENYLFTCYSTLQRMTIGPSDPAFTSSGEIYYPNNLDEATLGGGNDVGFRILNGNQNSDNPALNYWNGQNLGQSLFTAIRRCNIFLENIDKPKDLPQFEKSRWIAEVKFLKAYYHYYLLRMYGPIPLIRTNAAIDASTEELRVKREPVQVAFKYVEDLIDEATPDLPTTIQNPVQGLGRITQLIALSLKAEILTTEASPFFNGNPDYAGFKDKDGTQLFPVVYDPEKWRVAMNACRLAIDYCIGNNLALYKFIAPGNFPTLPDRLKTIMDIKQSITEKWQLNPELIWATNNTFGNQNMSIPRLNSEMVENLGGAPGNFAVPIVMAELFYTKNGVPMNEDKAYDYRGRYTVDNVPSSEEYVLESGYETVKMHMGREPRFYADLAFDGSKYLGNGNVTPTDLFHVEARGATSVAGPKDNVRVNVSGYWPQKLVSYQSVYGKDVTENSYHMPLIRLAGLYLMYAETVNEVNGPTAEAFKYIDLVRERAGLEGVKDSWTKYSSNPTKPDTKNGLRSIIQQERRIELCFEGRIGWDLRRWKVMQQVLSTPLQGWNISEESAVGYYRQRNLAIPVFGLKDYLWPIKYDELIINPNLVQNPYW
ncbi:RagB/SusD family nutrient uptake outer membrane protein [Pedobacter sp. MC2016-14]|uniref:RagB/SusD family nutrient uptake outer membrane protein n=1 Tax=Pedobacter sp. MC2016-14 TaxID=2897327 RepID=UPI001E5823DB|nr:RagB/SusD family nutrient uptake outer membrane protein [Pedobacter sp. MC2016-14]MCD0490474.1 RagB/SusD family nutrient uptake outer membrane protein [Pedobacter sp. MC2016-14]